MAAPSWEAVGTYFEADTSTPAFAVPAGVASGKIVVISAFINTAVTISSFATGFTHAEGSPVDVAGNHSLNVLWKRATGNDTGTYSFTLSAGAFTAGAAELFDSCIASGNPFDTPVDTAFSTAAASDTPSVDVDTDGPDRRLLHRGTIWSGGVWIPPTGFTERVDSGFGHIISSDKLQAAQGNSGSVVATSTGSDKRAAWLGALKGTTVGGSVTSISDEARTNMLADRSLSEPQQLTNTDLMRLILEDAGQTLITETGASAAAHLEKYLMELRNS